MYLHYLELNNFRKYKYLEVEFNSGLNLLVGENDSGKTAIIDAIKYVLNTQSYDYIRPKTEDFHIDSHCSSSFSIKCTFMGFTTDEAKHFIDWLGVDDKNNFFLNIWMDASTKNGKIFYDIKAGSDNEGSLINSEARDLLRATYLKPLRDAQSELTPKKGSRLSQILYNHDIFSDGENSYLSEIMQQTNKSIEEFFTVNKGKSLLDDINSYLDNFSLENNKLNSKFGVSNHSLKSILETLSLQLSNQASSDNNQGLGSHNLLYIAAELLLLKKNDYQGLKLGLIEEIEAHLHPQTQIRLIEAMQTISEAHKIQLILTTHSTSLTSKVKLKNLILCKDGGLYPMGDKHTELREGDYRFLERFLDSTKANLFFASGVILVEGDAENILLPIFAKKLGRDFSQHGVSLVNVGSTAFLRYSNIFLRKNSNTLNINVSLITDVDVKPFIHEIKHTKNQLDQLGEPLKDSSNKNIKVDMTAEEVELKRQTSITNKKQNFKSPVIAFIAPYWTLEYCIARSCLSKLFYQAVYICHKTKTKDYVYSDEEKTKYIEEALIKYQIWQNEGKDSDHIAYEIYKKTLLDKDLSKAVVAQVFASLISDDNFDGVASDENLSYLVDAIKNVTGKQP